MFYDSIEQVKEQIVHANTKLKETNNFPGMGIGFRVDSDPTIVIIVVIREGYEIEEFICIDEAIQYMWDVTNAIVSGEMR